ncbi:hypothetical protein [Microbacterium sp. NPDC080220]|uniref:hypothetical protein n=1 Tax=Microbacterium sp. NPDC080220 TaxID=3161017 RepID=UPI00341853D3
MDLHRPRHRPGAHAVRRLDRAGPAIFAFSTPERAQAAAAGFGIPPEETGRLLAVPLPDAAGWVASYAEAGVASMVFDAPAIGAMAPLANLAAMAVWIQQHPEG